MTIYEENGVEKSPQQPSSKKKKRVKKKICFHGGCKSLCQKSHFMEVSKIQSTPCLMYLHWENERKLHANLFTNRRKMTKSQDFFSSNSRNQVAFIHKSYTHAVTQPKGKLFMLVKDH